MPNFIKSLPFGWAGGGMILISAGYNIYNAVYPFTNYNFISQNTARWLFWFSCTIFIIGSIFILIAIFRFFLKINKRKTLKASNTELDDIDKLPKLLSDLDKRIMAYKDKAVQYNWVNKKPKDLKEIVKIFVDAKGIVKYKDWDRWQEDVRAKTIGKRKRIKNRGEVSDILMEIFPLFVKAVKDEKDLEIISSTMDGVDVGIKRFHDKDKKYYPIYNKIFDIKEVNMDKKLKTLVYKYISWSYSTYNFTDLLESLLKWVGYDYLPPEFISSGVITPYLTIDETKSDILIEINNRIRELKSGGFPNISSLVASIEPQSGDPSKGAIWRHIRVTNPNAEPIDECYGLLLSFYSKDSVNNNQCPPSGFYYPWSSYGGRVKRSKIGGHGGFDKLDIAVVNWPDYKDTLFTPELSADEYNRQMIHPLPKGIYFAEIQVGSTAIVLEPVNIKLKLIFDGGANLQIEELN